MSSNKTTYYSLNQWAEDDAVLRAEFNDDNAKVDAALRNLATSKANSSTVTALQTTVSGKANADDLAALQTTVNGKAASTTVTAIGTRVTTLENTITGKANNSTVTSVTNRVSALESSVATKAAATALTAATNRITALESGLKSNVTALRNENMWVKLKEVSAESTANSVSLSFGTLNLSDYRELRIFYEVYGPASILLRINGVSSGYRHCYINGAASSSASGIAIATFAGRQSGEIVIRENNASRCFAHTTGESVQEGNGCSVICSGEIVPVAKDSINSVTIYAGSSTALLTAGTHRITLYGIK